MQFIFLILINVINVMFFFILLKIFFNLMENINLIENTIQE